MYYQTEKDLIIVKVGTNVLTDTTGTNDALDQQSFNLIGQQVRALTDQGVGVILVSSGAITAGVLGEKKRRENPHGTNAHEGFPHQSRASGHHSRGACVHRCGG